MTAFKLQEILEQKIYILLQLSPIFDLLPLFFFLNKRTKVPNPFTETHHYTAKNTTAFVNFTTFEDILVSFLSNKNFT